MKKTITILILSYISIGIYGQKDLKDKLDSLFQSTEAYINPKDSVDDDCVCVPYYLCDARSVLSDSKNDRCSSYLDVCCNPQDKLSKPKREIKNDCGYRNIDGVGFRITGDRNNEAQFGEFPWMVAILAEELKAGTEKILNVYKCGGALIHPSVVVTAAHCVSTQEKKYKIRAGEWDTQTMKEILPHQDRSVKSIIIHEDSGKLFNDVAMLFLEKPVDIIDNVNTLCLPEQDVEIKPGTRCFATGWGKDDFGQEGIYAVILKKIDLPIVDHVTCQNQLKSTELGTNFELNKSFVCAGGEGKDTCKGDGGSPLVCPIPGHRNRYQHIGIVSLRTSCAEYNKTGIYTNVGIFRRWIDEQMSLHNIDTSYYQL